MKTYTSYKQYEPVSKFEYKRKIFNFVKLPNSGGIVPVLCIVLYVYIRRNHKKTAFK